MWRDGRCDRLFSRSPLWPDLNTSRRNNVRGRQDMDNKLMKACRPNGKIRNCDICDDSGTYDAISN